VKLNGIAAVKWACGAALALWAHDVPAMMQTLIIFMCVDYATGLAAAAIEGKLSSRAGLVGLTQKLALIAMLLFAHYLEQVTGHEWGAETLGAFGYAVNELISIVENFARIGVPIPAPWVAALLQAKKLVRFRRATPEEIAALDEEKP
jgi:toxin secretion/phage lysis holin